MTEPQWLHQLQQIHDPILQKPLGQNVSCRWDQGWIIEVVLPYAGLGLEMDFMQRFAKIVTEPFTVQLQVAVKRHAVQSTLRPAEGIKNVIVVASGKGGVGKSTTALNLALALQTNGATVGVLDADIYGPSLPTMLGVSRKPESHDGKSMIPLSVYGLAVNSIGFLVDAQHSVAWRGPMATSALTQLFAQTAWGALDYLVIDLPPGTGDIHLTLCQKIPIAAGIVVTTPQDVALIDVARGIELFRKLDVAVLGVVENMSFYQCEACGHTVHLFGGAVNASAPCGAVPATAERAHWIPSLDVGSHRIADRFGLPVLQQMPLVPSICQDLDQGKPTVVADPTGQVTAWYRQMAYRVSAGLSQRPTDTKHLFPPIVTVSPSPVTGTGPGANPH